jgi:hypothetical protein
MDRCSQCDENLVILVCLPRSSETRAANKNVLQLQSYQKLRRDVAGISFFGHDLGWVKWPEGHALQACNLVHINLEWVR